MDERRIEDAYRRYFPVIRAKCRRITRDVRLADELAQETFIRLWEARSSLREPDAVLGWLYRTATRLAIDALRRGRFERLGHAEDSSASEGGERVLVDRLDAARLARRLDDDHLEVALLRYVDEMTQIEIAKATGRSDRTVRRMLDRVDAIATEAEWSHA